MLTLKFPARASDSRASHPPTHDFPGLAIASLSRKTATIAAPAKPAASDAPAAPTTACQQVSPAQPGSAAGAECPTASPMLQTCKPACCHQAITVSKATSSGISSDAREKRSCRTASQQHIDAYVMVCVLYFVLCSWRQSVRSFRCLVHHSTQIQEAEVLPNALGTLREPASTLHVEAVGPRTNPVKVLSLSQGGSRYRISYLRQSFEQVRES